MKIFFRVTFVVFLSSISWAAAVQSVSDMDRSSANLILTPEGTAAQLVNGRCDDCHKTSNASDRGRRRVQVGDLATQVQRDLPAEEEDQGTPTKNAETK